MNKGNDRYKAVWNEAYEVASREISSRVNADRAAAKTSRFAERFTERNADGAVARDIRAVGAAAAVAADRFAALDAWSEAVNTLRY